MAGIELIVGHNVGRHSRSSLAEYQFRASLTARVIYRNSKRCRHVFDKSNYVEIIPEGKKLNGLILVTNVGVFSSGDLFGNPLIAALVAAIIVRYNVNWKPLPSSGGYVSRHRDKRMHFSRYVCSCARTGRSYIESRRLSAGTVRAPEQNVALTYCRCIAYART